MKQDSLIKQIIDRQKGGTISYKMERGTAGELIFALAGGSWNFKDIITVKLRHSGGVDVVVDRVPALLLAFLCDLKRGRPSIGSQKVYGTFSDTEETYIGSGNTHYFVNAFKVALGHISLNHAQSELEITVELAKAFGNDVTVKVANITPANGVDHILQYDKTNDLESTHLLVREVFLYGKNGVSLFETTGTVDQVKGKDIDVMIFTDSDAYQTDIELLGAETSISGELDHNVSTLVRAFSDNESLPTPSLRIKVTGEDVADVALLFIKEKMIQQMTSHSTIAQIERVQAKTEAIERMDASVAKAYRHAGSSRPSGELAMMKAQVERITPAE